MKTEFIIKSIKVGDLVGTYYGCGKKTDTVVIYASGGPSVPDNGGLSGSKFILEVGVDIFVPDYLGFGRSEGIFTPKNCIKTMLLAYQYLKKGMVATCFYDMSKVDLKYKRIIFIGKSLGGAYVPLLPRFNKDIKEIGVFCGAVDQSEQGKVKGEETNEDFVRTIELGGYKHLYRGFMKNKKLWMDHLYDKDGLSPMDNIKYLKEVKVFIAHGKKDECIHYSKAVNFYNALKDSSSDMKHNYKLRLYKNGDHGKSTTARAAKDFIKWIGVE